MARKKKHEEHENHERWLVSYADFITLLFAFFVVMYSLSSVNEGKYRVLAESLVAAFRSPAKSIEPVQVGNPMRTPPIPTTQDQNAPAPPQPGMAPPVSLPISSRQDQARAAAEAQARLENARAQVIEKMADELEQALGPLIDKDLVSVRRNKFWMEVEIKTSILFPSGSAQLSGPAQATLRKIAAILAGYPNPVHVEGFTDNQPIRTLAFPSNWELSAARAASVVHLFSDAGIDAERMAAVGYGQHHPIADNKTVEGRNANRRVVLVVLADPNARRLRDLAGGGAVPPEAAADAADGAAAGVSVTVTDAPAPASESAPPPGGGAGP